MISVGKINYCVHKDLLCILFYIYFLLFWSHFHFSEGNMWLVFYFFFFCIFKITKSIFSSSWKLQETKVWVHWQILHHTTFFLYFETSSFSFSSCLFLFLSYLIFFHFFLFCNALIFYSSTSLCFLCPFAHKPCS